MSGTRWANVGAELALLGLCAFDAAAFDAARDLVAAGDFYDPTRAFAWEAIGAVRARRQPLTEAALEDELTRRGQAALCGAPGAFAAWRQAARKVRDVADAAAIVAHNAAARRTVDAAQAILDRAEHGEPDPEALAAFAVGAVVDAAQGTGDLEVATLADALEAFCADVERRMESPGPRGPTTGVPALDDMIVCLEPGDLHVLAAGPGVGKTTLATNIATHVARLGRGAVLYFSLEMEKEQLAARITAGAARVNNRAFRLANVTQEQWTASVGAMGELAPLPLLIADRTDVTAAQIRAAARRVAARTSLALVVVDYCQLVAPAKARRDQTREREIAEIVWSLKVLANELKVPVLLLSQLNREAEKQQRKPRLSDLRESGSLGQDAAVVLLLHQEPKGPVTCIVAKSRHDARGEVPLAMDGGTSTFTNAPPARDRDDHAPEEPSDDDF